MKVCGAEFGEDHVCGKSMTCIILETCLWKLKSLSKITPKWRTLSDGDISLSSKLTGKWLESLCRCCFVPIIINFDLSEFSLSLLDFIHTEMSVRECSGLANGPEPLSDVAP